MPPLPRPRLLLAAWLLAALVALLLALDLPADAATRRALPLHAAGWIAWLGYLAAAPTPRLLRMTAALVLGALAAHLGWALLHAPWVARHPVLLLDGASGYSILFVPLGVLLLAPRGARGARFRADALAALPLAFATARLACLESGCCHGAESAWWPGGAVPTAAFEAVACLALAAALVLPRAASHPARGALALLGLGAIRLAVEPWRAETALGPPWIPAAFVAGAWVALGLAGLWRSGVGGGLAAPPGRTPAAVPLVLTERGR